MSDKTKANMAAAKMLGKSIRISSGRMEEFFETKHPPMSGWIPSGFNIFANPADCLAAVKCLGEKYGVNIIYDWHGLSGVVGWVATGVRSGYHDRPEDAVGAACIAVMEGEGE